MIKSLKDARITDGLPRIVSGQDWVIALSEALGKLHEKTLQYADNSQIYTALDTASEEILDILAVNWKIDWYDTGFSVDQKRRIVKACFESRRVMGTARAVRLQAQAIYPGTEVKEWFDIGSHPGTFDLDLYELPTYDNLKQFFNAINYTKNVRSHLRQMLVFLSGDLDGDDVMKGRPDKDPYGVETHYEVNYKGQILTQEKIDLQSIERHMTLPFWGEVLYNGAYHYDGSVLYGSNRRYNLALGMVVGRWLMQNDEKMQADSIAFQAKIKNEHSHTLRTTYNVVLNFWDLLYYNGKAIYDGSYRYQNQRAAFKVNVNFKAGIRTTEKLGEAAVLTMTKDTPLYNGAHRYDGSVKYRSVYKKEVLE